MIQRGDIEPVQARLAIEQKVRPVYEKLYRCKLVEELPTWPELAELAKASDPVVLRKLDHPSWSGWLHGSSAVWRGRTNSEARSG